MKDPLIERLREAAWRRKLTAAEIQQVQSWMAEHPQESKDWDLELELTEAIAHLPDVPVPSNFTSLVLGQVERDQSTNVRESGGWYSRWHVRLRWLPRVAVASVVLAAGLLSYQHVQDSKRRHQAESVREIVSYTAVPGPEILQDYEAIQAMSQSPAPDVELLKALQ
jgi:hypothetical protein